MSFAELTSYDYELCVNSVRGGEYSYNATEGNLQGSTNPCEFLYVILPEAYSGYSAYCTENCFIGRTLEFTFLICLATTEGGEFDINFHMSSVEGMTKLKSTETLPSFYYCPQISSIVDCEVNVTTYEDHSTVNFQAETSECQQPCVTLLSFSIILELLQSKIIVYVMHILVQPVFVIPHMVPILILQQMSIFNSSTSLL